jgi:hypothetical protein
MRNVLGSRASIIGLALLTAAMTLVGSDTAVGQEKKKISWTTKPENLTVTFLHRLEIPNMPGHRISMASTRRTWPDGGGPVIEGRKPIESLSWETSDAVVGNGNAHFYTLTRYENGDQTFSEGRSVSQSVVNPDGTRKVTYVNTSVLTGGTGTLKGIKGIGRGSGTIEYDANFDKPTRVQSSNELEYWFEK